MVIDGSFKYETDLLKHYVRLNVWLPAAKERLRRIRAGARRQADQRRMKYFTFCAVGAIDVLMLDVAKVVRRSESGRFDTVVFFDATEERVLATRARIPGAIGFHGDFVDTVNMSDPGESEAFDADPPDEEASLAPQTAALDVRATREHQLALANRHSFIQQFPFDVVNLDLEEFLFRPSDPYPGKLLNALRKVFEWQRRPLRRAGRNSVPIGGFTLMFTTQIGPANLPEAYLQRLEDRVQTNLIRFQGLSDLLSARTEFTTVQNLRSQDFELFFKIAMPKMIAATLWEQDWFVESDEGITIYEFERDSSTGPYKMLHLAMHVRRKSPPIHQRGPGDEPTEAVAEYERAIRDLFARPETRIDLSGIDPVTLRNSLNKIFSRRRQYYPEDEPIVV
jgi:hypothetical protein